MASLRVLGWPDGRLPDKNVLLEHMLKRVEYEYADHLAEHGSMPGKWCRECQCICARAAVDDEDSSDSSTDGSGDGTTAGVAEQDMEQDADGIDDQLCSDDDGSDMADDSCSAGAAA